MRILEEASDLGDEIRLGRVQSPSARGLEISLRDAQTLVRLLLRGGRFLPRELRRNQRRLGPLAFGPCAGGGCCRHAWAHRPVMRRHTGGQCWKFQTQLRNGILRDLRRRLRLNYRSHLYCCGPRDARPPPYAASAQQRTGTTDENDA